ncbi:MerR family transcriptional regulator [Bacillus testis]|uniref:MerR family transcriptional regulator n=1 Tax=Bacillus testis TaxID=1622072 RepID=UPI00067F615C|nr:MerR family transcriptional regulator [Bacillus testis]
MYKISELAELADVSVRTLHHYDAIGLLKPDAISPAGYRYYSAANLDTLQQILFFREIGFTLKEIKQIIYSPSFDKQAALTNHRAFLEMKIARLQTMMATIDHTLEKDQGVRIMSDKELFKGLSMEEMKEHQQKYRQEAIERYGKEAIAETEHKTNRYSKEDWNDIQQSTSAIYQRLIDAMPLGPNSKQAQTAIAEWRQFITNHYYDCTLEIFRGLADLYVEDERFTANIDQYATGLASFMREAMIVYCDWEKK